MKRISVGRAIWTGMAWVNGPVLFLLIGPLWIFNGAIERGLIGPAYRWLATVLFGAGFVLAWTWWSFNVPRWRLWAYERVIDIQKLKEDAVTYGLTWPGGTWFGKTEIKSATQRRREAELDPKRTIVPAGDDDVSFAHDLARDNMAETFAAAGIAWDPTLIPATWKSTDNYRLCDNDERIGMMRLRRDADALYVSDLQIQRSHQNRRAGTCALRFAAWLAGEAGLSRLRLRVFRNSPALALYRREGFEVVADEGAKLLMDKRLKT